MRELGKYQILEELGRGGFGAVYRALDTTLKREVALKVLNPALLHEEGWLARFRREAQVIAALEHPRIVTVYEIAEADNRAFIAMKLLRGLSLDKVLAERGALPWNETQRIMREVAEALTYAHAQGVLHRDLKPANIVLDAATGAVLTDFGFARLMGDTSLSASGGLVGTPHYIAPELWQNQPPSPASDLYALGCILYEMVLGRKAFPGDTSPAVMMAHFQPLALPEAWPEGMPPGLADVLRRALAQEPAERFPTITALTETLTALQVDPWAAPYAALEAAVAAQAWPEALALAEPLHAQAPDYRATARLLEQAKAELARADLIAQWRTQAETALAAGQLQAARAAAEQWLRLAPGDGKAQAALTRITAAEAKPTPQPVVEEIPRPEPATHAYLQSQPVLQPASLAVNFVKKELGGETQSKPAKALHWTFVLWWILATVLGGSLGLVVGILQLMVVVFGLGLTVVIGLVTDGGGWSFLLAFGLAVVVIGIVIGSVIGILQWWILRLHIRKACWWIFATNLSVGVGWSICLILVLALLEVMSEAVTIGVAVTVGLTVVGVVAGILQWWILRPQIRKAGWWILVTTVGWIAGGIVGGAMRMIAMTIDTGMVVSAVGLLVSLATGGAVIGVITGLFLFWLLRNHKIAEN